ncbi:MAG: hypothetical protein A2Z20_00240 [Bdellovibrionales bacterium RBG_16_40_8]|nr:MAG: hypothetical protein A2Z20_00240 [Bdellovibrionales bacterium RBG_16_40_8]
MVFNRTTLIIFTVATFFCSSYAVAAEKWQGQVPKVAEQPEIWQELIPALIDKGMYYGALASAENMLNFFSDLPSKELAYQTVVQLIDMGYPFSTRAIFIPGDLDPKGSDNFTQSYLVYKGIVNIDKKMLKWSEYYFNKVDQSNFPKFLFYKAAQAYQKKKLVETVNLLKQTLTKATTAEHAILAQKAARTLARIYYEMHEFEKSQEIYQTFLLKMNPITPSDWLESAWNYYQMKQYPEALGLVYNFESKAAGESLQVEKYILRALIYREYCSTEAADSMIKSFEKEFGEIIDGIKLGEPLVKFPLLVKVAHPDTQEYRQFAQTIVELKNESERLDDLPKKLRDIASYVYENELKMADRRLRVQDNRIRDILARHLIILSESLKFVKFDVVRAKYNPEHVFLQEEPIATPLVDSSDEYKFRLHWLQWGDYWRDERLLYRGILKNQCQP